MFGRETRMLLRHYLEHGKSKSALARQLGVSRDTIHRWIREGEFDRDLDDTPVAYGPRRPIATKLDRYRPSSRPASRPIRSCPPCGCLRRSAPPGTRAGIPSSRRWCGSCGRHRRPAGGALRNTGRSPGAGGLRGVPVPWGKRYALLVVLGYSRLLWCRFGARQDMRTLITAWRTRFWRLAACRRSSSLIR